MSDETVKSTRTTFNIRPLQARDYPIWRRLFDGYITFYKSHVADDVVKLTFARLLSDEPGTHEALVVVDSADEPFGLAHIIFHRSTWSPTHYCYLEDLYVDPAARAKGAGRALVEAVYAVADQRQVTRTYWSTQEFNYRARGMYDQVATKSVFVQYRR
jgi:GNAT superfamily N-acetyltransferase